MSRDIVVLTPNGRRIKVHCTPDTSILQVLEDVCAKQGLQSNDYDLKHHNHILDLSTTIRFCNLPNKAFLEMVEAEKRRVESNVTVGLMLNDGERMTGNFSPSTSLYDLIVSLAPNELPSLQNPTISYMRQEVTGLSALKEKSLRQLGLIAGRAILRLLDKTETMQANVSSVYRRRRPDDPENLNETSHTYKAYDNCMPGTSNGVHKNKAELKSFDPVQFMRQEKEQEEMKMEIDPQSETDSPEESNTPKYIDTPKEIDTQNVVMDKHTKQSKDTTTPSPSLNPVITQEILERRLKIEEEVTFIGSQKAIAFMQPDGLEQEVSDLPDDFYDLTIDEVRKIYHELQQQRIELENTPMLTATKREELAQASISKFDMYKNVVVRIQFPDNIILQGVFTPNNTLEDVQNFVKEHLQQDKPFHIFTTPLKEILNPKMTLLEAKFVPCVHMHFKWLEENLGVPYLKEEIYSKKTSSEAASILASKYRAPCRNKLEDSPTTSSGSSSRQNKVPKWFKK